MMLEIRELVCTHRSALIDAELTKERWRIALVEVYDDRIRHVVLSGRGGKVIIGHSSVVVTLSWLGVLY